ncbi:MAG: threonylcarbamoyl-AMP synthase [Actinobacteria bacterium]|nr:threonylcarbamoyl-AMP synthase [Actinomycetota bacterium]
MSGHVVDDVAIAAAELRAGRPVVLPTDTVYGVAAPVGDAAAVADIFRRKGRDGAKPMAVLVADAAQAAVLTDADLGILADFWPGPLTVVVRRAPGAELNLGPGVDRLDTVGLRCPDHDLIRALAAEVGPLATTSANRSGEATPTTAVEAAAGLGGDLLAIDGGLCNGVPSTVVDLTVEPARILREGAIGPAALNAAGLEVAPR